MMCSVAAAFAPYGTSAQTASRLGYVAEEMVPGSVFGRPRVVTVAPDGNVVATFPDTDSGRILIIDRESGYPRPIHVGRVIAGTFPFRVGWIADTAWATDVGSSTAVLFDSAWNRRGERALELPREDVLTPLLGVMALGSEGTILVQTTVPPRWSWPGQLPAWTGAMGTQFRSPDDAVQRHPILRASPAQEHPDTVLWLSTRNQALVLTPGAMRQGRTSLVESFQPFGDYPLIAWHTARQQVVLVDRRVANGTTSPAYDVFVISFTGDTLRRSRYHYDPMRLTDVMFRNVALEYAGRLADDSTEALAIAAEGVYRPDWIPPVSRVLMGPEGWIWIRREAPPETDTVAWDILDPSGERVGMIDLSASLDVRAVRGLEAWALRGTEESGPGLWRIRVAQKRVPAEPQGSATLESRSSSQPRPPEGVKAPVSR